jgi:electron transfer flavoprotein-quinone oxidoreductase
VKCVEKFDVIVVGAGPAGSAAAITLAREGYDVLVLEKAQIPGQRNVSGGVLFGSFQKGLGLIDLIPDFEQDAPLERKIKTHELYILDRARPSNGETSYRYLKLDKNSFLTKLGLTMLDAKTGHDYTVLRARFDRWFASRAVEEGAMLATSKTVEDLLIKDGKIVGVQTPDEELYADVVIDAGGVTSLLPEKAGLRGKLMPEQTYHGVKHVYKVAPSKIEEFFTVDDAFKTVYLLGDFMHGIVGGGFVYPNKDTVSIGIVFGLDSALKVFSKNFTEIGKPEELLEEMESHPFLADLLDKAALVEYSAHNIPRGYKVFPKKPYAPGFLVAGDALGVFYKIGALIDGMRPAIASGILAARAYMAARRKGDFGESGLALYAELLEPLKRLVQKSRGNSSLLENRFAYGVAPKVAFSFGLSKKKTVKNRVIRYDGGDALQRIQKLTGMLNYHEDKVRSHIKVDQQAASLDGLKMWIPLCPVNCYTLLTEKGVFASFKDLYRFNLESLKQSLQEPEAARKAAEMTVDDIRRGVLKFDHVACVACGTCGVIGPPSVVRFGHEWGGHGVRFKYG